MWVFPRAVVSRVVDGDTVELDVDLGFNIYRRAAFRLLGINAREIHEPGGREAKANLASLLPPGSAVSLTSVKADKFGDRYDAILHIGTTNIADILIATGWAAAWEGTGGPDRYRRGRGRFDEPASQGCVRGGAAEDAAGASAGHGCPHGACRLRSELLDHGPDLHRCR